MKNWLSSQRCTTGGRESIKHESLLTHVEQYRSLRVAFSLLSFSITTLVTPNQPLAAYIHAFDIRRTARQQHQIASYYLHDSQSSSAGTYSIPAYSNLRWQTTLH